MALRSVTVICVVKIAHSLLITVFVIPDHTSILPRSERKSFEYINIYKLALQLAEPVGIVEIVTHQTLL